MTARNDRRVRKGLIFAAVVGAHALLIALLISQASTVHVPTPTGVPMLAFFLPATPRRRVRFGPPRLGKLALRIESVVAPITLAMQGIEVPIPVPRPINWARAARAAVRRVLRHHPTLHFGFPGTEGALRARSVASGQPPLDHAYRLPTGQIMDRVTHNCYVISRPAPLGATQVMRMAQMSSVWCEGRAAGGPSQDNLFKDLPAYKSYQKERQLTLRRLSQPTGHRHER